MIYQCFTGSDTVVGNGKFAHKMFPQTQDRGAWWATVHGIAESDATERPTLQTQEMQTALDSIATLPVPRPLPSSQSSPEVLSKCQVIFCSSGH